MAWRPGKRLRGIAARLVLLAVGSLIGLALGELVVRIALPRYKSVQTDRAMWDYHARYGWLTRPGIEVSQIFGRSRRVPVKTNSRGFRDGESSFEPTRGKTRVVVLGDSFAFGFGVPVEQRVTEIVEELRDDVECVNLGVSGYSTDQELLLYRDLGSRYSPDAVVLMYVTNDPAANRSTLGHGHPKPVFRLEGDELVLRNVPVPPSRWRLRLKYALIRHSALFNLLREKHGLSREGLNGRSTPGATAPSGAPTSWSERSEITRRLILQLRDEVEASGARFLVLLVISTSVLDRNVPDNEQLLEWCRESGIDCVDTYPVFANRARIRPDTVLFLEDRQHWSPAGHRIAAEALLDELDRRGWLSSSP